MVPAQFRYSLILLGENVCHPERCWSVEYVVKWATDLPDPSLNLPILPKGVDYERQ